MTEPEPAVTASMLLVDDDADLRVVLARWLGQQGVRVLQATRTVEAVEIVRAASRLGVGLNGLLVDFRLPDATGCRVVSEFLDEFPGVQVALMTGAYDLSLELWLRAQRIPLFRKPLDLDGLGAWVRRLTGVSACRRPGALAISARTGEDGGAAGTRAGWRGGRSGATADGGGGEAAGRRTGEWASWRAGGAAKSDFRQRKSGRVPAAIRRPKPSLSSDKGRSPTST